MAGPWLLPIAGAVVGGGISAAKGGSFGDIAKGALLGGATGGLVGGAGSALGIGAASTAAKGATAVKAGGVASGAAKTALTGSERLLQSAVAPSTSTASAASQTILAPKYMLSDTGKIVIKTADKVNDLDKMMKYAGYANTASGLLDQLGGSPEEDAGFQPMPQQQPIQLEPVNDDLYQQLLRLSQQG